MTSVIVAEPQLPRPFPVVLQSSSEAYQNSSSRIISYSSNSTSACSSSPSTGSWSHTCRSHSSSHPSSFYHSQLPRGARPASPQPSRPIEHRDLYPSLVSNATPLNSNEKNVNSSWKLDWRGISKIVKWAIPSDKTRTGNKLSKKRLKPESSIYLETTEPQQSTLWSSLHKPLPEEPPQVPYTPCIYASPTSPLSPSTSTTCVDLTSDDGFKPHAPLSDDHYSGFAYSTPYLPSPPTSEEYARPSNQLRTLRYGGHVNSLDNTLVQCTVSDLGHSAVRGAEQSSLGYIFSDNGCTNSVTFPSSRRDSLQRRVVHSDVGHYESMAAPPSAYPSALSLPFGRDPAHVFNERYPSFKSYDLPQSVATLSVSTSMYNSSLSRNQRPRKLRKSMKAIVASQTIPSTISTTIIPNRPVSVSRKTIVSALSAPIAPAPIPGPRRKLKRKSVKLPPVPQADSIGNLDTPPPVPPKQSILTNKNVSQSIVSSKPTKILTTTSVTQDNSRCSFQVSTSTSDEAEEHRPLRRPSLLRTVSNRRWTVAIADSPDELIVEELDRLRRMGLRAGDVHGGQYAADLTIEKAQGLSRNLSSSQSEHNHTDKPGMDKITSFEKEEEEKWTSARQAIFLCRELVRTERSYKTRLQELKDGQISDKVPGLLLQYVPALIEASTELTRRFHEDMSALGVAEAFIHIMKDLEEAFVPWCGVVGKFYDDPRRRNSMTSPSRSNEFGMKAFRTLSMNSNSRHEWEILFPMTFGTAFRNDYRSSSESSTEDDIFSGLRKKIRQRQSEKERRHLPSFKDFAILPVQRVPRYVLLYKELLKCTPVDSPAREMIEKAATAAANLAQKYP